MKELTLKELTGDEAVLAECARKATSLSYSPYSHFAVGAAALLDNGEIVSGGNQENASYPVGICAERGTLATAQNLYPGVAVRMLALTARTASGAFADDVVTPCGMCRQAMAEWEKRYQCHIRILMMSQDKVIVADGVKELLPLAFS